MPLKKVGKNRWRAISYSTGKLLGKPGGESRAKAEARSATSRRRSKRKRHTRQVAKSVRRLGIAQRAQARYKKRLAKVRRMRRRRK